MGEEVFKFTLLSFSPACGVTIYPNASYFPGWKGRRGPTTDHMSGHSQAVGGVWEAGEGDSSYSLEHRLGT